MEKTLHQQIFDLVAKAQRIVIALPKVYSIDALAGALALVAFFGKLEKDAELVTSGQLPTALPFLPGIDTVKHNIAAYNSLVLKLRTAEKHLDELSYAEEEDGAVKIFLKAKQGVFTKEDVEFESSKFPIDAIICLECRSLEDLDRIFEEHAELFFQTPKINIDNSSENEQFGEINFVNLNASSISEMLSGLFKEYEQQLVDEDMATCLLAGIITKTESFRHIKTTPSAFSHASDLVALGARQQDIVRHIFKTKPLVFLKLWGKVLAKLDLNEEKKLAFALLTPEDFSGIAEGRDLLLPALAEVRSNMQTGYSACILAEQAQGKIYLAADFPSQELMAAVEKNFGQAAVRIPWAGSFGQGRLYELKNINTESAKQKILSVF